MKNIVDEMTKKLLTDAGVKRGMKILDVGCGVGNLSLMLEEIIGPEGSILGVDNDENALAAARKRFQEMGVSNITFLKKELNEFSLEHDGFDAIVERRVLMYLNDPKKLIARLTPLLKTGGVIVAQEHDRTMAPGSVTPMPLHDKVNKWTWDAVKHEGCNIHLGFDLWNLLAQEGLAVEKIRAEAVVQTPDEPYPMEPIVRAMQSRIINAGAATKEEIDIETLEARLAEEREKTKSIYIKEMVFCAWARKKA